MRIPWYTLENNFLKRKFLKRVFPLIKKILKLENLLHFNAREYRKNFKKKKMLKISYKIVIHLKRDKADQKKKEPEIKNKCAVNFKTSPTSSTAYEGMSTCDRHTSQHCVLLVARPSCFPVTVPGSFDSLFSSFLLMLAISESR